MIRRIAVSLAAASLAALLAASCAKPPAPGVPPVPPVAGETPAPPPAPPGRPPRIPITGEPWIRVGLEIAADSVAFSTLQPLRFDDGHTRLAERAGSFAVRLEEGRVAVRPAGERSEAGFALAPGDTLALVPANPREPAVLWRGRTWRGELRVFANARRKLTVVARLPLETYLLGVVPGEIGGLAENLLEAGRAQAVAARSYTLFYLGRRADEGFDLYGTVEDQVFGPVESERPLATRCVTSTRGDVLLSRGWPIRANYCSTCGGITSDVWEAWPVEPLPYLVSHRDRDGGEDFCASSPHFRWREEWTAAEFAANLARYAPNFAVALPAAGVGEILDVRAESRSRSGRVWRLVVETRTGRIEIPAYAIRQVVRRAGNAGSILRSNLFKVDVRRDPATRRALAIVASGAGNGHGAGLCQTGAIGMARAGRTAERILAHYYPGAALERLY